MKIATIPKLIINPAFCPQKAQFSPKSASPSFSGDQFIADNIDYTNFEQGGDIIVFKKPLLITQALNAIITTQNEAIKTGFEQKLHSKEEIQAMFIDLSKCKELDDIKVEKMCGMGCFALAFETTDGNILKISSENHFPHNRKPAFFDIPIIKSGKSGKTYFYLEEKADCESLKNSEINNLVTAILNNGYIIHDYSTTVRNEDCEYRTFRKEQFGKTKDGKVYVVDPGCVYEPDNLRFKIKRNIIDRLKGLI